MHVWIDFIFHSASTITIILLKSQISKEHFSFLIHCVWLVGLCFYVCPPVSSFLPVVSLFLLLPLLFLVPFLWSSSYPSLTSLSASPRRLSPQECRHPHCRRRGTVVKVWTSLHWCSCGSPNLRRKVTRCSRWQCWLVWCSVHHCGEWNVSTTQNKLIVMIFGFGWIGTEFCTDTHGSQKIYPNNFGDPLTSSLSPPWGWHLWS